MKQSFVGRSPEQRYHGRPPRGHNASPREKRGEVAVSIAQAQRRLMYPFEPDTERETANWGYQAQSGGSGYHHAPELPGYWAYAHHLAASLNPTPPAIRFRISSWIYLAGQLLKSK